MMEQEKQKMVNKIQDQRIVNWYIYIYIYIHYL